MAVDYENELLRFPNSRYDDQVDATTMILELSVDKYIQKMIELKEKKKIKVRLKGIFRLQEDTFLNMKLLWLAACGTMVDGKISD